MHPMFTAALFTIAKTQKQPVSINRWMDKDNVVCRCIHTHTHTHTHTEEHYSATMKKEILPSATIWMAIMLSEISQTETSTIQSYVWSLRKRTKHKELSHRYKGRIGGCQRWGVGGCWVWANEKIQVIGCTTVWIYLILLNCTLRNG